MTLFGSDSLVSLGFYKSMSSTIKIFHILQNKRLFLTIISSAYYIKLYQLIVQV